MAAQTCWRIAEAALGQDISRQAANHVKGVKLIERKDIGERVAVLEQQAHGNEAQHKDIIDRLEQISDQQREMLVSLTEEKVGRKILVWIGGGVIATIAALAGPDLWAALWSWLRHAGAPSSKSGGSG